MTTVSEYRLYVHPALPPRIVKRGICWPALIVGPVWLLLKKLWVPSIILLIGIAIAYYLNHHNLSDEPLYVLYDCIIEYGKWYSRTGDDYQCERRTEIIDFLILLVAQIATAVISNPLWELDLIRRGYTLTKSLRARSMDDVRAILAREAI